MSSPKTLATRGTNTRKSPSPLSRALSYTNEEGGIVLTQQAMQVAALAASASKNPKLAKAVSISGSLFSIGSMIFQTYTRYTEYKHREEQHFYIEVDEGISYDYIMSLVFDQMSPEDIGSLRMDVRTKHGNRGRQLSVNYLIDTEIDTKITLGDHVVRVVKESTTSPSSTSITALSSSDMGVDIKKKHQSISLLCKSPEIRDDVMKFLEEQIMASIKPKPSFFVAGKWGGFDRVSEIPERHKESVILKEGQMDRILNHLSSFLEQEEHYTKLGIPYRTGILLSGNPGSGKSSTASAIAFELGLDVYFVSLSSVDSDDKLISIMEDLPSRSVLILEDIDVARATKDRTDTAGTGVTMSGLLNALDGFTSPHGVITLMTTNHKDSMDPAVIRPGRVDLSEEISDIDDYQLRGICKHFLGFVPEGLPEISVEDGITSASLVGVLKKYIPNMSDASEELVDFVSNKVKTFTK